MDDATRPGHLSAVSPNSSGMAPSRRRIPRAGDASEPLPVLRLHEPADVVDAIPYLLGFRPRDSVVLVGIEQGADGLTAGRVRITLRMDVADLGGPDPAPPPDDWPARATGGPGAADAGGGLAGHFAGDCQGDVAGDLQDGARRAAAAIGRSGATAVLGAVFLDSELSAHQADAAALRVARACTEAGLTLGSLLVVVSPQLAQSSALAESTTFAETGTVSRRRDVDGRDGDPPVTRVAAEATYAGLVALDDRADVVSLLEPAAQRGRLSSALDAERGLLTGGGSAAVRRRRGAIRAVFAATRTLAVVDQGQLIRFGAALSTVEVRDACWLAAEAGRIDGELLWRELSRQLPAPYDAAPLFLFGWQRWRSGDGVLAGIAARRALDSDGTYTAANLLHLAVSDGLDPFRTPRLRKGA